MTYNLQLLIFSLLFFPCFSTIELLFGQKLQFENQTVFHIQNLPKKFAIHITIVVGNIKTDGLFLDEQFQRSLKYSIITIDKKMILQVDNIYSSREIFFTIYPTSTFANYLIEVRDISQIENELEFNLVSTMTNYELVPIGYQIHFTYPIALTFDQIMVFSYNCLVQYDRITFEQGKVFEIEMNLGKYFSLYTIRSIFPHDEYCKLMINIPTVSNGNI